MQSIVLLSVANKPFMLKRHYAECRCADWEDS